MSIIRRTIASVATASAISVAVVSAANAATVCNLNPYGDNYLSLRTCASSKCQELHRLGPDTQLDVYEWKRGWYHVQTEQGWWGWVHSRYVCGAPG